ncbi:hypothetical protein FHL15_010837 [Xylaria flabelliformis]|uniref:Uncharacterized protein n=1 Tax=Xylaria flabelliformis TaxID=2512241 RepID=A0A553HJY9_9PEZI|nr:hypothetical protein FHL15_010837 [Xylaria flabelliformis]
MEPAPDSGSTATQATTITTITTTTAATIANTAPANAPARRSHPCGIDNCPFTSATAKGIREHQKNKHLGTECYWLLPDGEFCSHTTASHEELYEHFNQAHLRPARQNGPSHQCPWPGTPGIPIPGGPPVLPEGRCQHIFQNSSSAERHAREHQYKIWRVIDSVVWPLPQQ